MHTCELCGATMEIPYDREMPNGIVLLICLKCDDTIEDAIIEEMEWNPQIGE